eukprot:scaffold1741_cov262-Pinguiococcus_pyrenoidosus.AAC.9
MLQWVSKAPFCREKRQGGIAAYLRGLGRCSSIDHVKRFPPLAGTKVEEIPPVQRITTALDRHAKALGGRANVLGAHEAPEEVGVASDNGQGVAGPRGRHVPFLPGLEPVHRRRTQLSERRNGVKDHNPRSGCSDATYHRGRR